ncbi:hypothetical protein CPB85DRAFT_1252618 [Mucidula mucida]|nr:hypothetical protein CPB85DRAFT_1252618 [Mucidula mucida]
MSCKELDRMNKMFYHPNRLDFCWIDDLSSETELEVLAEYGQGECEATEDHHAEESVNSWSHVADFDELEIAMATRLSNKTYQHNPLGLIGPEEYFNRLEDNISMSLEGYSNFPNDESTFFPQFLVEEDSDSDSLSSECTYFPSPHFHRTNSSNSDLDLLTDDSGSEVIRAMAPFGHRTQTARRCRR